MSPEGSEILTAMLTWWALDSRPCVTTTITCWHSSVARNGLSWRCATHMAAMDTTYEANIAVSLTSMLLQSNRKIKEISLNRVKKIQYTTH